MNLIMHSVVSIFLIKYEYNRIRRLYRQTKGCWSYSRGCRRERPLCGGVHLPYCSPVARILWIRNVDALYSCSCELWGHPCWIVCDRTDSGPAEDPPNGGELHQCELEAVERDIWDSRQVEKHGIRIESDRTSHNPSRSPPAQSTLDTALL